MRRLPWTSPSMNDGGSSSAHERCRVDSGCSHDAGDRLPEDARPPSRATMGRTPVPRLQRHPPLICPVRSTGGLNSRCQSCQSSAVRIVVSKSSKLMDVFVASMRAASSPTNVRNGIEGSMAARTMASATAWGSEGGPPPSRLVREFRNARARSSWTEPVQLAG